MLRINQQSSAAGAKSYYVADYYMEGQSQELAGVWRGEAAKLLGLSGTIEKADWDALCENRHPKTGQRLTLRTKSNRTICYDITFNAPKSLSILYSLTQSDRILDAWHDAVESTARDMEAELKTRVRKDGRNEEQTVGNWVAGRYTHFTTRPIDSVPDCHLHTHFVAMNVCFHKEENAWKAATFRDLKRDAPYFEAVFHSRLARNLAELGLPIERNNKGWEISGISRSTVKKYSRRSDEIDARIERLGITDPAEKAEQGAKTRSRKAKHLTMPQLQTEWRNRLSPEEREIIAHLEQQIGADHFPCSTATAQRAVDYAIAHEFERRAVVPLRQLKATALRQAVGKATLEQIAEELSRRNLILSDRSGRTMATTREVLAEEQSILDWARRGRGTCKPLGRSGYPLKRTWLNDSQQRAVRGILNSSDSLIAVLRGIAGAGKTTTLLEAVEAIEAGGTKVFGFAPTTDASRITLREAGFKDAETVSRLLVNKSLQQRAAGQVLLVDEAGMLSSKTAAQLFALADRLDARILLVGDEMQHGSVERGSLLQMLATEAGVKRLVLSEVQRPKGIHKREYTAIVKALSQGNVKDAFNRLDGLGWIREIPDAERYRQLASDYVDAVSRGESALVISPTHAEGRLCNLEIRRLLKERFNEQVEKELPAHPFLSGESRMVRVLQNANLTEAERGDATKYDRPGMVLQFHQHAKNYRRGQRVEVNGKQLPLEHAARFSVFTSSWLELAVGERIRINQTVFDLSGKHRLDAGAIYRVKAFDHDGNIVLNNNWVLSRDVGHFSYAYTVTSHKSQSRTVDRVLIGQSDLSFPASSRKQFYVSCSRGRYSATIYCREKQALRDAVADSDERLTATELVHRSAQREVVALHQRYQHQAFEQVALHREERSYGR